MSESMDQLSLKLARAKKRAKRDGTANYHHSVIARPSTVQVEDTKAAVT